VPARPTRCLTQPSHPRTLRTAPRRNLNAQDPAQKYAHHKNSLSALTAQFGLSAEIERLADGSQPHRALWDTIAAALLLPALIAKAWPAGATLADLLGVAGIDLGIVSPASASTAVIRDVLFGTAG
jgi:DNA polymerase III epsilon subunit-like protein